MTIEQVFTYTSSLYFRGKMAYARRFARPPRASAEQGIFIIAPGFGLVSPTWVVDVPRLQTLAATAVDPRCPEYRGALERDAGRLADQMPSNVCVVLLGSLATGKYLDLLLPAFGSRLFTPQPLIGAGDMRRGAILLRAAASGHELDYVPCLPLRPTS